MGLHFGLVSLLWLYSRLSLCLFLLQQPSVLNAVLNSPFLSNVLNKGATNVTHLLCIRIGMPNCIRMKMNVLKFETRDTQCTPLVDQLIRLFVRG